MRSVIRYQTNTEFLEDTSGPPTDVLEPCSFYLVHGAPGAAIRQWLRDDGMSRLARSPWPGGGYRFSPIGDHRSIYGEWDERRRDFASAYGRLSTGGEGCIAGRIEAGRRVVLDPTAYGDLESYPEVEEWISSGHARNGEPFGGRERTWMGDLGAEFGHDRLTQFWTSDQTVEEAFVAAFGEPIGEWTMRWAQ